MCMAQTNELTILYEQKNINRLVEQNTDNKTYLTQVSIYSPTNMSIFWGSEMNNEDFEKQEIKFCMVYYLESESKLSRDETISVAYFSKEADIYKIYESSYLNQWGWRETENHPWMPMSYEASKGECSYIGNSDNEDLLAAKIWNCIKDKVPFYQIKDLIRKENIAVFSSNYTLYGDLSRRVMSILADQVPNIDVYSIDEAFLDLAGIENLSEFGQKLVRTTARSSGIPVSLGVAPTRTLAKLANSFAKRYPAYKRVCIIDSDEKRIKALQRTPVGFVWGIGRQTTKTLEYYGIKTAYDLTQKSRSWVRSKMSVVGERTWLELQGEPCITSDSVVEKQQICTSRSFGKMVTSYDSLRESVANFASSCASKLRRQQSLAQGMIVFAYTNRHRKDLQQYYPSKAVQLSFATADSIEIIKLASEALKDIYKEGYEYKKAGIILTHIIKETDYMHDLFDPRDREKQKRISQMIDSINQKNGTNCIKLAAQGVGKADWNLRRDFLSKCPSTNIRDIIEVKI